MRYRITRRVTVGECPWLGKDLQPGEYVYGYSGATYGCISSGGKAMTGNPDSPFAFFEVPNNAFEPAPEGIRAAIAEMTQELDALPSNQGRYSPGTPMLTPAGSQSADMKSEIASEDGATPKQAVFRDPGQTFLDRAATVEKMRLLIGANIDRAGRLKDLFDNEQKINVEIHREVLRLRAERPLLDAEILRLQMREATLMVDYTLKARAFNQVREALVGLIGADGLEDLGNMKTVMELMPGHEDKPVALAGVEALLATLGPYSDPSPIEQVRDAPASASGNSITPEADGA